MRARIEATFPDGGRVALLVHDRDIGHEPWQEQVRRVAELITRPDVEWTVIPIAEGMTDKTALTGH